MQGIEVPGTVLLATQNPADLLADASVKTALTSALAKTVDFSRDRVRIDAVSLQRRLRQRSDATAAGIGPRRLREDFVRVNFTLIASSRAGATRAKEVLGQTSALAMQAAIQQSLHDQGVSRTVLVAAVLVDGQGNGPSISTAPLPRFQPVPAPSPQEQASDSDGGSAIGIYIGVAVAGVCIVGILAASALFYFSAVNRNAKVVPTETTSATQVARKISALQQQQQQQLQPQKREHLMLQQPPGKQQSMASRKQGAEQEVGSTAATPHTDRSSLGAQVATGARGVPNGFSKSSSLSSSPTGSRQSSARSRSVGAVGPVAQLTASVYNSGDSTARSSASTVALRRHSSGTVGANGEHRPRQGQGPQMVGQRSQSSPRKLEGAAAMPRASLEAGQLQASSHTPQLSTGTKIHERWPSSYPQNGARRSSRGNVRRQ